MSTTIGFGYSTEGNVDLFNELQTLSNKYDYGLFSGIDPEEVDICDGVVTAQKNEQWDRVLFLQSPLGSPRRLAFDIDQELTNFEIKEIRPKFFDFLIELTNIFSGRFLKLGLFFAGDWLSSQSVNATH